MKLKDLLQNIERLQDAQMVYPVASFLRANGVKLDAEIPDDRPVEIEVGELRKLDKKPKRKPKSEGTADEQQPKVDDV